MTDDETDDDGFTWEALDDATDEVAADADTEEALNALEEQLADREQTIDELRDKLDASEDAIDTLKGKIEDAADAVDKRDETIDECREVLLSLADDADDLDEAIADLRVVDPNAIPMPESAVGRTFVDRIRAVMFTLLGVSIALFTLIALIYTGVLTPLLVDTPSLTAADTDNGADFDRAHVEAEIHEEINERRQAAGVAPLSFNQTLARVAGNQSNRMAAHGDLTNVTTIGPPLHDRLQQAGYECNIVVNGSYRARGGENLAVAYYDRPYNTSEGMKEYETPEQLADGVVDDWMESPQRRQVVLAPYWSAEGIGVNMTANQTVHITQAIC